jgi:hypothetical protein
MESILGPERPGGQGLDQNQEESGNRTIWALLRDPEVCDQVDLVITCRDSTYEVWAARGMVRFQRVLRDGRLAFPIVEQLGDNPIARQQHDALATCAEELRAAAASGYPTKDVNQAFIAPEQVTYPYAYERIAQLFDSPLAPDIVVSPKCYAFGLQLGQQLPAFFLGGKLRQLHPGGDGKDPAGRHPQTLYEQILGDLDTNRCPVVSPKLKCVGIAWRNPSARRKAWQTLVVNMPSLDWVRLWSGNGQRPAPTRFTWRLSETAWRMPASKLLRSMAF